MWLKGWEVNLAASLLWFHNVSLHPLPPAPAKPGVAALCACPHTRQDRDPKRNPSPQGTFWAATAWLKCFLWTAVLSTWSKSCHFLHSMAQLTSQCTNTIYRWQFKRCGSPQQDKGQAVPGGCSLPGCSRGSGGVWARGAGRRVGGGCGLGGGGAPAQLRKCTRLRRSGGCAERAVSEVKCKQLAEKGCIQPGLPPSRAWRGERVVTGYSTYLAPFICKPWQFPEQSPQHQKRWGELPAKARVPPPHPHRRWESAPIRRGGPAF